MASKLREMVSSDTDNPLNFCPVNNYDGRTWAFTGS